ncbi:hypothetical protein DXG01_005604 [Tephrocybe rancida]|nr:hypothetical protein DXG01_005604 [Tephrocybe rancida]
MSTARAARRTRSSDAISALKVETPEDPNATMVSETVSPESSGPVKRKREEQPTSDTLKRIKIGLEPEPYTKHSRFWAVDGNVLLQIGSTRFKVHRSRFARESPWFSRLFERSSQSAVDGTSGNDSRNPLFALIDADFGEVGNNEKGEDRQMKNDGSEDEEEEAQYGSNRDASGSDEDEDFSDVDTVKVAAAEGSPLYFLDPMDVSVKDFTALLVALDDGILLVVIMLNFAASGYYYNPPTVATAISIHRAADVLRVKRLSSFAKTYIEGIFSDKLEDVTSNRQTKTAGMYAAEAVVHGRNWEMSTILKRAFYELVRQPNLGTSGTYEDPTATIHRLERIDLVRLAHAREQLFTMWIDASNFPAFDCQTTVSSTGKACTSKVTRLQHWDYVTNNGLFKKYRLDPICGLQELIKKGWKGIGYCDNCVKERKALLRTEQEKIWTAMETWFDI